jgi:hypothetical protein
MFDILDDRKDISGLRIGQCEEAFILEKTVNYYGLS